MKRSAGSARQMWNYISRMERIKKVTRRFLLNCVFAKVEIPHVSSQLIEFTQ